MGRDRTNQTKHDKEVRRIAEALEKKGMKVKADVTGFPRPDTVGGYRPDVVATGEGKREIIEVETPDSVGSARDQKQQAAFKKAAARSKSTTFRRKVTK